MSSNDLDPGGQTGTNSESGPSAPSGADFIDTSDGISIRWNALVSFALRSSVLAVFAAIIHAMVRYVNAFYDAVEWVISEVDSTLAALGQVPLFRAAARESAANLPDNAFAFVAALILVFAAMWVVDRYIGGVV